MIFEHCMLCVEMAKITIFKVHIPDIFMRRQICVWTFLRNLHHRSFAEYFPKISSSSTFLDWSSETCWMLDSVIWLSVTPRCANQNNIVLYAFSDWTPKNQIYSVSQQRSKPRFATSRNEVTKAVYNSRWWLTCGFKVRHSSELKKTARNVKIHPPHLHL